MPNPVYIFIFDIWFVYEQLEGNSYHMNQITFIERFQVLLSNSSGIGNLV